MLGLPVRTRLGEKFQMFYVFSSFGLGRLVPVSLCGIVPLGPVGGLVVVPSLWGTVPQLPEPEGGSQH